MKIHYPVFHLSSPFFFFFSASHFSLSLSFFSFFNDGGNVVIDQINVRPRRRYSLSWARDLCSFFGKQPIEGRLLTGRVLLKHRPPSVTWMAFPCDLYNSFDTFHRFRFTMSLIMERWKQSVKTTVFTEYFSLHSGTMLGCASGLSKFPVCQVSVSTVGQRLSIQQVSNPFPKLR